MSLDNPPINQSLFDEKKNIDFQWKSWFSAIQEKTLQITSLSTAVNNITTKLISKYYFNISGSSGNFVVTLDKSYQYKTVVYSGSSVTVTTATGSSILFALDTVLTCLEVTATKAFGKLCYEFKQINNDSTITYVYVTTAGDLTYALPIGAIAQIYLTESKL